MIAAHYGQTSCSIPVVGDKTTLEWSDGGARLCGSVFVYLCA